MIKMKGVDISIKVDGRELLHMLRKIGDKDDVDFLIDQVHDRLFDFFLKYDERLEFKQIEAGDIKKKEE